MDIKLLNILLKKKIQQNIKGAYILYQSRGSVYLLLNFFPNIFLGILPGITSGIIPEMQSCFSTQKSVTIIHYLNRIKEKKNHVIPVDTERTCNKI